MDKNYKVILWDLDGTLLDFKQSERYALGYCLAQFGVEMTEELLASYSAINDACWKKLERGEMTKAELLPGRFRLFFEKEGITHIDPVAIQPMYQVELGTKTFYKDNSLQLLQDLKAAGYRQYVVTNGVKMTQDIKMRNSGFDRIVDGTFISEELGYEKPRVEFFEEMLRRLPGNNIEEMLLIGDSVSSDMKGAAAAGIDACYYAPNEESGELLSAKGAEISDTWKYQISHLDQLRKLLL